MVAQGKPGDARGRRRPGDWVLALLLFAPMWAIYVLHFLCAPEGSTGTGFLQYDQPSYMANAREHFDGGFSPTYGLPYSPDYETPRLYFQPQTLGLGLLWALTGVDPGWLYALFGALAGVCFFRVAIALYRSLWDLSCFRDVLGLLCFIWGGGLFVAPMLLLTLGSLNFSSSGLKQLSLLGSGTDLWFLNLGRNTFYATEATYHVMSLGLILLLLRGRYGAALATAGLLSISHPFTGIQFLLILFVWSAGECYWTKTAGLPRWLPSATLGLVGLHFAYYFGVLSLSEEYVAMRQQWYINWSLSGLVGVLAYGGVGVFAALGIRREVRASGWRLSREARLLLVWAAVSLALVHHDLFMRPIQPLHFTRGYVWTPLFLLGLPVLMTLFSRLLQLRPRPLGAALALVLTGIWLLDNAVWFSRQIWGAARGNLYRSFQLTPDQRDAFETLHDGPYRGGLLLSDSPEFDYLAMTYTPLRAWYSHPTNTPYAERRRDELEHFFEDGVEAARWREMRMIVALSGVWPEGAERLPQHGFRKTWSRGKLSLYVREPQPTVRGLSTPAGGGSR